MKQLKVIIFGFVASIVFLTACSSLPKSEEFKYSQGEIVYYVIDNVPMLIDKQVFKNEQKSYKVVFKNEEGAVVSNTVKEEEIQTSPNK